MVRVIQVSAKSIPDSRNEKTIFVMIRFNNGSFSSSSPSGKSRGKKEAKPYKKNLNDDIKTIKKLSDYFSDTDFNSFKDLKEAEDILENQVGANTIFAFESCILKAMAKEEKKEIWEIIQDSGIEKGKKMPRIVGNCIGGGKHSSGYGSKNKKPDFQEFLLIPENKNIKDNQDTNKEIKKKVKVAIEENDDLFDGEKTDEDAWKISLGNKEVLDLLSDFKIPLGIDAASSTFYKRGKYSYLNPRMKRNSEEQMEYISNLMQNFNIFYIEDPFHEEDFDNFSKLLKKFPNKLIVGDDLIVTDPERLKKAVKKKSVNAIIIKPNQIGSLLKVKEVCDLARKNNIKTVFSHRSGETEENILADLAFGFQANFIKTGITGKERESKINRLIEIEGGLK